jgi:hypothetical protein
LTGDSWGINLVSGSARSVHRRNILGAQMPAIHGFHHEMRDLAMGGQTHAFAGNRVKRIGQGRIDGAVTRAKQCAIAHIERTRLRRGDQDGFHDGGEFCLERRDRYAFLGERNCKLGKPNHGKVP